LLQDVIYGVQKAMTIPGFQSFLFALLLVGNALGFSFFAAIIIGFSG
jgi:hypothetical protein